MAAAAAAKMAARRPLTMPPPRTAPGTPVPKPGGVQMPQSPSLFKEVAFALAVGGFFAGLYHMYHLNERRKTFEFYDGLEKQEITTSIKKPRAMNA